MKRCAITPNFFRITVMLVAFPALAYSAPAPKTAEIALPGSAAPSSTVSISPAPSSTANSAANSGTQKQEMPFTGWKQFSTGHFRFIYEDASKEIAEGFASFADDAWNRVLHAYDAPPEMTDVIITGRTGTVNAYAQTLSHYMGFFTTPPASPVFGYREHWQRLFFTHELVHVTHLTIREPGVLTKTFGPVMNLGRTFSMPGWYMEGLTTVFETELTSGGRGRSPWFELTFKAPILENAFLDFSEIGLEKEPPRGQIYVMGYLVMRSIADRFGLQALGDIERSCGNGIKFEESVELVTGFTPEQLFNDARKALTKKYAQERTIPEGIPLVRSSERADRYRPAFVSEKEILTIRTDKDSKDAAVRIDPATGEETVLFEGNFPDEFSLTAAENGLIIASLSKTRYQGMPGKTTSADLYVWDDTTGLRQLTSHGGLYQPALSRTGNKLVAVELAGPRYRLVEVDPASGAVTVLSEAHGKSYIHPALSHDGSQVAFLALDGTRAVLATALMPRYDFAYPVPESTIAWQTNRDGPIQDIDYPNWTERGTLQYASNQRGRLEVWEIENGQSKPVLADPAGAFWLAPVGDLICYASYAASGYTLKVKPAAEFGSVPPFDGPSVPGAIVTLGAQATDYADLEQLRTNAISAAKFKDSDKIRPEIRKRTNMPASSTPLHPGEESIFFNLPSVQLWLPLADFFATPDQELYVGAGAFAFASGFPLQNGERTPLIAASALWYPEAGQVTASIIADLPVHTFNCLFYGNRMFSFDEDSRFIEYTEALASISMPVVYESFWNDTFSLSLISGLFTGAVRSADSLFSMNSQKSFSSGITGLFSVTSRYSKVSFDQKNILSIRLEPSLFVSHFPGISEKAWFSGEVIGTVRGGTRMIQGELELKARYADLPADAPVPGSLVAPRGTYLDSRYAGRSLIQGALVLPLDFTTRFFMEKMISWGKNTTGTYSSTESADKPVLIDPWWYAGIEAELEADRIRLTYGAQQRFKADKDYDFAENFTLFCTLKIDAYVTKD